MKVTNFNDVLIEQKVSEYVANNLQENLEVYDDDIRKATDDGYYDGYNSGIEEGFRDGYLQCLKDLGIRT